MIFVLINIMPKTAIDLTKLVLNPDITIKSFFLGEKIFCCLIGA